MQLTGQWNAIRWSHICSYAIAKAILFKVAHKAIRPLFPALQSNITAYTVSVLALKAEDRFDFRRVWQEQAISPQVQR
jgi:hypothetical protein